MTGVLDELDLTGLVTSIPGLSTVGAAQILAECGDPSRFSSPRALVKHAGLSPRENTSGNQHGSARISSRGRPGLRPAAWRAVWGALHANPVYAARFQHLTTRADNPLAPAKPEQRSPPRCCASSTSWSHAGSSGTPHSPRPPPLRHSPPD